MIHKKRTERKTLIGNQRDMDFLIACLCKGVRTKKDNRRVYACRKNRIFLVLIKPRFCSSKNTSAGKWETIDGALIKL